MDKTAIYTDDLLEFLNRSVVNFFAVDTVRRRLEQEGFRRLEARERESIPTRTTILKNISWKTASLGKIRLRFVRRPIIK